MHCEICGGGDTTVRACTSGPTVEGHHYLCDKCRENKIKNDRSSGEAGCIHCTFMLLDFVRDERDELRKQVQQQLHYGKSHCHKMVEGGRNHYQAECTPEKRE